MSKFKRHLIEAIREHNRSASFDFLTDFEEPALHNYLVHLKHSGQPRAMGSPWVRACETTAVVTRHR